MFKRFKQFFTKETGQAMVIVAVSFVVLMGVTAFSVDLGMAASTKAKLQAAADAAALAGAQDLPSYTVAMDKAKEYAVKNGAVITDVTAVAPYAGNRKWIQVVITQDFDYIFAKVLGFDSKTIRVSAVAERRILWGGETLPFMNIDDNYTSGDPIVLWEKTQTGDFESLLDNNLHSEYEFTYEGSGKTKKAVNCMLDGLGLQTKQTYPAIDVKNGLDNSISAEVTQLLNLWKDQEFIWVLSIKDVPATPADQLNYINARSDKPGGNATTASINLNDIVLVKCQIVSWQVSQVSAGDRNITLQPIGGEGSVVNLGELLASGEEIPGFANTDFRVLLVE